MSSRVVSLLELAMMPPQMRVEYATRKYVNKLKRVEREAKDAIERYTEVMSTCSDRRNHDANVYIHEHVPVLVIDKSTLWKTLESEIEDSSTRDFIWTLVMQSQVISDRMKDHLNTTTEESDNDDNDDGVSLTLTNSTP